MFLQSTKNISKNKLKKKILKLLTAKKSIILTVKSALFKEKNNSNCQLRENWQ